MNPAMGMFKRYLAVAVGTVALTVGAFAVLAAESSSATPHSVFAFGAAEFHGSTGLVGLDQPIVGLAARPDGAGYWTVTRDGEVSPFGTAAWLGRAFAGPSVGVVGIAATPSGGGYWLATGDGVVHPFGDAADLGPALFESDAVSVVGIAATPSGGGYWLATAAGEVAGVGDARHLGDLTSVPLNQRIVGVTSTATGDGYWIVARDGGVFTFGDASFHGSLGDRLVRRAVTAMAPSGDGYLLLSADGGVFTFGDASFHGSLGDRDHPEPAVGIAATPDGDGYWVALTGHLAPAASPRGPASYLGPGENLVGGAGQPRHGTYRQLRAHESCTWTARDAEGDILATGSGDDRQIVRLRPSTASFSAASVCGTWTTDLFPVTEHLAGPVEDGTWLLGIDIQAGAWAAPGGPECTWSRLADVSGLTTGVLSGGGSGGGPQSVVLSGAEVAFRTSGCGAWEPV